MDDYRTANVTSIANRIAEDDNTGDKPTTSDQIKVHNSDDTTIKDINKVRTIIIRVGTNPTNLD